MLLNLLRNMHCTSNNVFLGFFTAELISLIMKEQSSIGIEET